MTKSVIREKSFDFAIKIIKLTKLLKVQKEFEIAGQLLRSGTSIGANIEEAQAGFSKKDFIAKLSISFKEAYETRYWLRLLEHFDEENNQISELLQDCDEIIRILASIINTSRNG